MSDEPDGMQRDQQRRRNESKAVSDERRSKVYVVRDMDRHSGKSSFVSALLYGDPYRFLVLQLKSTLDLKDLLLECYRARYRGWTGDSVIIVVRGRLDNQSCIVLQKAVRGVPITSQAYFREYWKPRNVWVITDSLPDLHSCRPKRWQVYNIEGNLHTDSMSSLRPIKLLTVKPILDKRVTKTR